MMKSRMDKWFTRLQRFRDTKVGRWFVSHSIRVHISMLYLLILFVSTALSGVLYRELYTDMAMTRVSEASQQTLESIRANLGGVVRNANNTSKMILSDSDLQALLTTGDLYSDLRLQGRIRAYLYKLLQDTPDIDSIHLFDIEGNQYAISRRSRQSQPAIVLRDTGWYRDAMMARGAFLLRLNGDGAFPGDENGNRISLIRTVRDINTTETIGVLVLNITEEAFRQAFGTISQQYATGFVLLDDKGASVLQTENLTRERITALQAIVFSDASTGDEMKLNGVPHMVSFLREPTLGWTLISLVPTERLFAEDMPALLTGFLVIGLNGVLLFVGLLLVSRMITNPIGRLLQSMRQVEAGKLEPWDIRAGNTEIRQLRESYNRMIERLRQLLQRIYLEQRAKRKHELNALQAQIKPHFLYNTLDSINALALMGEKEDVVRIVDALGVYYRLSLGRGREVVTVADEIEMVRQYLAIQRYRYEDVFAVSYDLDPAVNEVPLLKLVLQPLVENALYHGIRASGRKGTISLVTRRAGDVAVIELADDGNGMSPEAIGKALRVDWPVRPEGTGGDGGQAATTPSPEKPVPDTSVGSGVGLRGTVERLRIFYGREDVIGIRSEPGKGTRVTIRIPLAVAPFLKDTERILNGADPMPHDTLHDGDTTDALEDDEPSKWLDDEDATGFPEGDSMEELS